MHACGLHQITKKQVWTNGNINLISNDSTEILQRNHALRPITFQTTMSNSLSSRASKRPMQVVAYRNLFLNSFPLVSHAYEKCKCPTWCLVGIDVYTAAGSELSQFVATILHIGMFSFLLRSFNDGWTSISRMKILSSISKLLTSTSIFGGMCSVGQRYLRVDLILFRWPPVFKKMSSYQWKVKFRALFDQWKINYGRIYMNDWILLYIRTYLIKKNMRARV